MIRGGGYSGELLRKRATQQPGLSPERAALLTDPSAYISHLEAQLEATQLANKRASAAEAREEELSAACLRAESRTLALAKLVQIQQRLFEEAEARHVETLRALRDRVEVLERRALAQEPPAALLRPERPAVHSGGASHEQLVLAAQADVALRELAAHSPEGAEALAAAAEAARQQRQRVRDLLATCL